MKFFSIIFGLQVGLFLTEVNGYNILFFSVFASKSHKNVFDPVAEELGKRGHNVTFFTSVKDTKTVANVTEVYSDELAETLTKGEFILFETPLDISIVLLDLTIDLINVTYSHPLIQDIIQNPRDLKTNAPKYDLVVIDAAMNDFALPLAYHMRVPVVYIAPSLLIASHFWGLDIPFPLSSVTNGMTKLPARMAFLDRTFNAFVTICMHLEITYIHYTIDSLIKQYIPNVPPLRQLLHNVSFVISNDHPVMGRITPTMPYYVQLGGIHCKPAKKLPDELENFMQSAGEAGVIYFSIGSFTKGALMPTALKQKLAKVFAQLPQKILWKNDDIFEDMPKNVKFIRWAPQQDILGHSNVKLFISHGGGLSIQEAGYHGCPILAFPLIGDQFGNIGNAMSVGFGDYFNWNTVTTDELLNKIKLMMEDESYRINAQKVSRFFKDRPEHPVKTAAYWIEYVIRHNGAPHLKSGAEHLNLFQYFLLDVIGTVIAILVFVLAVFVFAIKRMLTFLFKCKQLTTINKQKKH